MNIENAIVLKELPVIEEYLKPISDEIDKKLEKVMHSVATAYEEDKKELKETRAELNKLKTELEDKRKSIKTQIEAPYKAFEEVYNNLIKDKLNLADSELKNAIDNIEANQKDEKELELRDFFKEYAEYYHVEAIVNYEDCQLNVTLSASMKSLKEKITTFLEKVSEDMVAISSHENRDEVLYEYQKNGFDYTKAINSLNAKKEEIKRLENALKLKEDIQAEEQKVIENVTTLLSAPTKIDEEILTVSFTVTAEKSKIKELKLWLEEKGIDYE